MITQLEAARQLVQRGRCIIPIPYGAKAPVLKHWTELRLTEAELEPHFTAPCNLGLLLGEPSGWVVDIDLDTDEAVRAAPFFFPPTYTYGRESRPGSHLLVICKGAKTQKYKFKDQLLLEVRSTGAQSLIPPSQHPSGDRYRNERHNRAAATISLAEIYEAAGRTAAAVLFALHWQGGRHHKALALSGALLHAGWDGDAAIEFVECVAQAALDDELEDRRRAAQDSVKRFAKGDRTTGWPALAAHFDEAVTQKVRCWLNIQDAPRLNGATYVQRDKSAASDRSDDVDAESWPPPQPLSAPAQSAPYPVEQLPGGVSEAVHEVLNFVQCPGSLVACAALSALSLTAHALADVRRADQLVGPIGLFLLAVAESGERKSTCDNFFTAAIREWETLQAEDKQPEVLLYEARMQAWNAKREGTLLAIKTLKKAGKETTTKESDLAELLANKPVAPRVPRLSHADTTPESLAYDLAHKWPSGGVLSNEAGVVFGGCAMGKESIMRNLALLNVLWDGGTLQIGRKTSLSYTLRGARLTLGLCVQPDIVRTFFENSKGLARGSGFAARFLFTYPDTTQGTRMFKAAPPSWPALSAFHRRLTALLNQLPTINERGELQLSQLSLSQPATASWVHFHNEVEYELRPFGDMADVRDVASKAADNAARLAALFHVYEYGAAGEISAGHVEAAARIVTWHLYEARRFLGEVAAPIQADNAMRLDAWLIAHCREGGVSSISTRDVQRYGPPALRDSQARDEAIAELIELSRARLIRDRHQKNIEINPALLGNEHGAA